MRIVRVMSSVPVRRVVKWKNVWERVLGFFLVGCGGDGMGGRNLWCCYSEPGRSRHDYEVGAACAAVLEVEVVTV